MPYNVPSDRIGERVGLFSIPSFAYSSIFKQSHLRQTHLFLMKVKKQSIIWEDTLGNK